MKVGLHELRRVKWTDADIREDGMKVRFGQSDVAAYKHVAADDTLGDVFVAQLPSKSVWAIDVPDGDWEQADVTARYYPVRLPYDISDVKKPYIGRAVPYKTWVICAISPDTITHAGGTLMTYVAAVNIRIDWVEDVTADVIEAWKSAIGHIPGIGWYQATTTLFGYDWLPLLPPDDVRDSFDVVLTREDPHGVLGAIDHMAGNPAF